jgi:hypothetical protein
MKLFGPSWKTTSAGILAILGAITHVAFAIVHKTLDETAVMTAGTAIVGGVGLIAARDNNVTSEQAGAGK